LCLKSVDQALLAGVLKKDEFDFIKENIDLYGQDSTIDEYINTFVAKLNETLSKKTKTVSKPKPVSKTKTVSKPQTVSKPKPVSKPKTVSKPKRKAIKRISTTKKRRKLEESPDWLLVIRKFIRMANKENSQTVLRRFLKEIQTKFKANKNRAPTPYISLIRRMQDTIIEQVNKNLGKKSFVLKVPKMFVSLLKQASAKVIVSKSKTSKLTKKNLSGIKKKAIRKRTYRA